MRESEACGRCGIHPDHARHVEAERYRCPTCEHRDVLAARIDPSHGHGMSVRYVTLSDPYEQAMFSSWALYTREGREERFRREQAE